MHHVVVENRVATNNKYCLFDFTGSVTDHHTSTLITLAPILRRKHAHYWTNVWINVSSLYGLRTHCIESVCNIVQFAGWSWPDKSALETSLELAIWIQFIRIQLVSLNYSDIKFLHLNTKTSQELRMLSSVTINCQITKIVMNSGSQLSEL